MRLRESMLAGKDLVTEEREDEVAEITATVVNEKAGKQRVVGLTRRECFE